MSKKVKKIAVIILSVFIGVIGAGIWYVNDYYHCEEEALKILENEENVIASVVQEGYFLDGPGNESAMIFYPGAKVQAESYLPILRRLAENGI